MRSLTCQTTGPAAIGAGAVLVVGAVIVLFYDFGPQTRHMGMHIASMNVAAPVLAAFAAANLRAAPSRSSWLWLATATQIGLVWMWHAPAVYDAVATSHGLQLAMHGSLFLAALSFWWSLLTTSATARWQAIPALLLTGKLVCLLAALMIFAPRTLYDAAGHLAIAADHLSTVGAIDDQHLAGLLMITACPLSYLTVAVAIAVQVIRSDAATLSVAG